MGIEVKIISDASPSGENLEYEQDFINLMLLAQPAEDRQFQDKGQDPKEPNFEKILGIIPDVLARSHDLRAAVLWAHASLKRGGLEGLAEPVAYVRGCLENFWDTCHPQLDEDDGDPTMRINAVTDLASGSTILKALRSAPLTDSRQIGRFSLGDIERAQDGSGGDEEAPTEALVTAAFRGTDPDLLATRHAAAASVLADLTAIDGVFIQRTPGQGPKLDPLIRMMRQIETRLAAEVHDDAGGGVAAADVPVAEAGTAQDGGTAMPDTPMTKSGPIRSQADVIRGLDEMVAYFEKNEPSSPLPILLKRARRLVGADFISIIDDIAPSGASEAKSLKGAVDDGD